MPDIYFQIMHIANNHKTDSLTTSGTPSIFSSFYYIFWQFSSNSHQFLLRLPVCYFCLLPLLFSFSHFSYFLPFQIIIFFFILFRCFSFFLYFPLFFPLLLTLFTLISFLLSLFPFTRYR